MIKFSVVIPVFNAEKTLTKCVNSILNQEYKNIEVILVNDGSTDNSLNQCMILQKKDYRISVINKENEGVAKARNDGLMVCTGDYVYFVDPDDLVDSKIFLECSSLLEEDKYDVLVFGHRKQIMGKSNIYFRDIIPQPFLVKDDINNKKKYLTDMYLSGAGFSAWDKLISIPFLKENNIFFPLLKRGQDMAFCANVFEKSNSIICIPQIYYYYLDFNTTNNNKVDPNIIKNHQYIFERLTKIFTSNIEEFYKNSFLQSIYLKWFFYVVVNNILKSNMTFKEKTNEIKKIYNSNFSKKTLNNFKLNNANNLQNKLILLLLKTHNVYLHILSVYTLNFIKTKLINYKRL